MTKVKIKNFQSIKEVDFEVNGFTVIVGKNNIGKSAVVRAIDSALINQVGKEFIRRGETSAEVYLDYEGQRKTLPKDGEESGLKLEWKKSGSSSSYTVNGKVFTKLGRAVPPPIIEAGFDHMSIGDTKISPLVAHQFEPLFLLDKPGSVVTEVLSSLYDLNVFSQADDACQKDLKVQKSLLKIREADFKIREEKLEVFKDFESIQSEVKISGEISVECDALSNELEILKKYEEALNKSSRLVTVLTPIKSTKIPDSTDCESLSNVLEALKKYEEALNRSDRLVTVLTPVREVEIPETDCADVIESLSIIAQYCNLVEVPTKAIKGLSGVTSVEIPEYSDKYLEEYRQIAAWESSVKVCAEGLKKVKTLIDSLNIESYQSEVDNLEQFSKDFISISDMEGEFRSTAITTKTARDELKQVITKLDSYEIEMSQIKVCPACERPYSNDGICIHNG